MKPDEDYEIGQDNLIAQLGLLILEGRKHLDVKSSIKDCVNCDDGLNHKKEDFLSFWQSCDSLMYIEVWLYQEQFNEKKAMNGHSDYLLIEQWEIEIKLHRSSEHGFHCSEKMLIQAIKSKLHFSQLSAWLSLTKGKFPRKIYFRLCERKEKTDLERFIRAPDFHQFPQVNISTTQELVVSIYSLPHSDLPIDYPVFSWALTDLPLGETPQREHAEKMPSNFEEHLVPKNECSYKVNRSKDYSVSPLHVVRKLEFEYLSSAVENTPGKEQCLEKNVNYIPLFGTSGNLSRTSTENSSCSTEQKFSAKKQAEKYSAKENENLIKNKKEMSTWYEPSNQEKNDLSLSKRHFHVSKSLLPKDDAKYSLSDAFPLDPFKREICEANEFNGSSKERTSLISKQKCDQGLCEIMQKSHKDDISSSCQITHSNTFACENADKFEEDKSSVKVYGNINCKEAYSDRKLDDSLERQRSKPECSSEEDFHPLKSNQTISVKERKFKNPPTDKQRSNSESLEEKCSNHTIKTSWSDDKYGSVLHQANKEIRNILPQVRRVMDKEYEKTLNERLRRCCLSSERSFERGELEKKPEKTRNREDNVFSDQKCATIPSRNSRYHFRHASTGTLAVFHPSTGLPMSSSPAPFRKTSQKRTVDDISSPSCEPSSLSDQCGNLSKSAPTLTTQSLLVNFEESVLNDRLLPDGVVEGFTAELGASGSKKCLPHITLPVQAYFFKLSDDNAPSPYMGYISLDVPGLRKKGYHVPKKGTIQLTLFNPNQTVVKVFVVLYDFSDMPPNFQTFLRQKTTSIVQSDGLVGRIHDNLHYLIHLRFTSSKSGRIYLHTDIRVIFARNPPDQSNLRTSTCGPTNPKYVPRHDAPGEF